MSLRHEARLLFVALQFLTRVPVPRRVGFEPAWLNASAGYFPWVGVVVGVWSAGVLAGAAQLFAMPVAVGLALIAGVVLTGAFHEDGLADTFDALGGAVSRQRALQIMKDSRIGTYGAMALLLVIGTKAALLASTPLRVAVPAWVLAHVASRAAAVMLIGAMPYAGDPDTAKARPLARQVPPARVAVGLLAVVAVVAVLLAWNPAWWRGVATSLVGVAAGGAVCGRWFARRLGGVTGDALGATQQLTELLALLGWAATWRWV